MSYQKIMNRKRLNRIIDTIVGLVYVEIIFIYRTRDHFANSGHPFSFWEFFHSSKFWGNLIFFTIYCYIGACYFEYKKEEQEDKRKKHDENEEEEDEDEDDT